MEQLRLYWIFSLIFITGCASFENLSENITKHVNQLSTDIAPENKTSAQYEYTLFSDAYGRQNSMGNLTAQYSFVDAKNENIKSDQDWKALYCSDGEQVKRLEYNIRAVIPPIPAGILVTEASQIQSGWRKKTSSAVKDFLIIGSNKPKIEKYNSNLPSLTAFYINESEGKSFEKRIYEKGFQLTSNPLILDKIIPSRSFYRSIAIDKNPIMFIRLSGEKRYYLTEFSVNYSGKTALPSFENKTFSPLLKNPIFQQSDKYIRNEKRLSLQYLGDMEILRNGFVLLVPTDKQAEVFGSCVHCRTEELDIKEFIRDSKLDFEKYIVKNTTIEEVQTESPEIIDFKVSLNLSPVCKYARPIGDFYSK